MKTKIILLASIMFAHNALAASAPEMCYIVGKTASSTMALRQSGESLESLLTKIGDNTNEPMLKMIGEIYKEPIRTTLRDKVEVISDYSIRYTIDCYENKESYGWR